VSLSEAAPDHSTPEWVTVAVLGKTRGNRGEILALPLSKPERYQALREVYLFGGGERYEVESAWFHDASLILKFRGIDSISEAEKLRGAEVRVPASERVALEPGEFFQSDLVGCEVVDRRTAESLGRVADWNESGGPGLLVLENGLMIPFVRSICVEIDPANKRIAVELPEGLKDLNLK
jgi:16S rRNA processing protein RimM